MLKGVESFQVGGFSAKIFQVGGFSRLVDFPGLLVSKQFLLSNCFTTKFIEMFHEKIQVSEWTCSLFARSRFLVMPVVHLPRPSVYGGKGNNFLSDLFEMHSQESFIAKK